MEDVLTFCRKNNIEFKMESHPDEPSIEVFYFRQLSTNKTFVYRNIGWSLNGSFLPNYLITRLYEEFDI